MRIQSVMLLAALYSVPLLASPLPISAKHAMVVTEKRIASQIGLEMLRSGGNAVDAAVAVGYALAVINPCCGNIGGGGFMTIHFANGKNTVINFRERAPLNAHKNMFLDKQGNVIPDATTYGYLAVAIPGTVLGLETALKRYGTLSRQIVMAPAIKLARDGFVVTPHDEKWFRRYANFFRDQPNVAAIFLKNGAPYTAGEKLVQTNLANTLALIAAKGPNAFYKGPIASAIVEASTANGGILTLNDFARYSVQELAPIRCTYHGYALITAPPPSGGGISLCEMLNILENFHFKAGERLTPQNLHIIIEAMRYGMIDRNTKIGDPNFVHNPVHLLLSEEYARALSHKIKASTINPGSAAKIKEHELSDTTHYSIIDSMGNAVSVTYTINGFFGAKVIAGHTGFFLNDEMDDFTAKIGAENKFELLQEGANAIQPGKMPLSSMTPTIIIKKGKVTMVIGSPGGPRIITAELLAILNVLHFNMNIQQAIDAPRYHYQGVPDVIDVEPNAIPATAALQLERWKYRMRPQETWASVEIVMADPNTHTLYGANDYRRPDGAAIGY